MSRRFRFTSSTKLCHITVLNTGTGGTSGGASPPTISSISPSNGSTAGGTSITITGTNLTGTTGVTVGGGNATDVSVVNSTSVTCTTPSGTAGLKNVVLTTPAGSVTKSNSFTYVGAPTVSGISPATGGSAGGTAVTITGTGFISESLAVTVGGSAATSVVLASDTTITCVTPSGSAGAQDVVVTTASGSATLSGGFTYTAFPTPDILNEASFESNFQGFCTSGFASPSGVTRDTTRAFAGSTSVLIDLPINVNNPSDIGHGFAFPIYAGSPLGAYTPSPAVPAQTWDRLYSRIYFYIDSAWDGVLKFGQYRASGFGTTFNTFYLDNGYLSLFLCPEITSTTVHTLWSVASLVGAWHSIEVDYWRNGDTANGGNDYPSLRIWLDGVSWNNNDFSLPGTAKWIDGRINFGARTSSEKIGVAEWLGILNGHTGTIHSQMWVDSACISSVGRIGP